MPHLVTFRTARFDVTAENENPFNPVAGESVLNWLHESVFPGHFESVDASPEDWGWYINVSKGGDSWMVGAIAYTDENTKPGDELDWLIQIHKDRSFKERLLGRNKLEADDALSAFIVAALKADLGISNVELQVEN